MTLTQGWLIYRLKRAYNTLNEMASSNADTLAVASYLIASSRYGYAKTCLENQLESTAKLSKQYKLRGHYWDDFYSHISFMPQTGRKSEKLDIWVLRDVNNIGHYQIDTQDTFEDILKMAGGEYVRESDNESDIAYFNIALNRRNAEGVSNIIVRRRDWSKRLCDFTPLGAVLSVEYVGSFQTQEMD